jgi:hypothetical protein
MELMSIILVLAGTFQLMSAVLMFLSARRVSRLWHELDERMSDIEGHLVL